MLEGLNLQRFEWRRARVCVTKKEANGVNFGKEAGSSSRRKYLSWLPITSGAALLNVSFNVCQNV